MYRGFDLLANDWDDSKYYHSGLNLFNTYKAEVFKKIKNFTSDNGKIDGSKMQENWFPQIDADVFISHSHKDQKKAISLAGFLYEELSIKSFVDSCIWGNSNELLKLLDKDYCYQEVSNTYNYEKRNKSTAHVHSMLSVALSMMMDKTECVFFLNTDSSITNADNLINHTDSPWIYYEISQSRLLRKKIPTRLSAEITKSFSLKENLRIQYEVKLDHLMQIDLKKLLTILIEYKKGSGKENLDRLYDLNKIIINS